MFEEISNALQEMSAGSKEVLAVNKSLSNLTYEVNNGYNEMKTGTQEIKKSMINIDDISSHVLSGLIDISNMAEDITNVIDSVVEQQEKNKTMMKQLDIEIEEFKT